MSRHKSFIYKFFIVVLLFSCWSCYDEPIEVFPEKTPQSGKLTIEEARTMFARYYMAHPVSRSFDSEESAVPLNPGMITPRLGESRTNLQRGQQLRERPYPSR